MGCYAQDAALASGPEEPCCCEYCGHPIECPPGDIRWQEYAEDQQPESEPAEHRMPPMLYIREALHWCKMMDEATDKMQELKSKGGEAERAANCILDILDNIRKWFMRDSPLAEGTALPSLWELIDDRKLEPWLPSVLRTMERELRENTAVNAHFYAREAVNRGSEAGAMDEFVYYCEVQLNCEYDELVHSRIMQAYHKTMKEEVLFRSLSQKLKARRGCKRKARKLRVRQWDGTGEWVRDNTAVTLREEQEGLTEKAIYNNDEITASLHWLPMGRGGRRYRSEIYPPVSGNRQGMAIIFLCCTRATSEA